VTAGEVMLFRPLGVDTAIVLLVIALLLVASAAISASEVALFSLDATRLRALKETKDKRGQRVIELLERPRRLLATILIANNLVNVGVVVLSAFALDRLVDTSGMHAAAVFAVQVLAVTFVLLLLGEVVPKVYATSDPTRVAMLMSAPLRTMRWLFGPVSTVLVRSTHWLEEQYGRNSSPNISVDVLGHALEFTQDAETTAEEQRILRGIVRFGNIAVKQVMRPRTEVVAFDKDLTFPELLIAIVDSGFSRVPVHEGTLDRVIGVLHIKDVLPHLDKQAFDWHTLLRAPFFVPETRKLDDLLKDFQREKVHMAVVVDEHGGTSGIVTLEDVLEEIVGEITDEYDDEEQMYHRVDERTWSFDARTALPDVYRALGIDGQVFEEKRGESGTIGGFVLELTGRLPKKGERVPLRNFLFTVEAADDKRIRRVRLRMDHENA
jgi:gliding motility-associated protein GldE